MEAPRFTKNKARKRFEATVSKFGYGSRILVPYDGGDLVTEKKWVEGCSEYCVFSASDPGRLVRVVWRPMPSEADQDKHTRVLLDEHGKPRQSGGVMASLEDAVFV